MTSVTQTLNLHSWVLESRGRDPSTISLQISHLGLRISVVHSTKLRNATYRAWPSRQGIFLLAEISDPLHPVETRV